MKYKVGDKVRVVSERTSGMNPGGDMDKYIGGIVTIREVLFDSYKIHEDFGEYLGYGWIWRDEMFAGLAIEQSIHITKDGLTTHAVLKNGKKVVKKAKATCAPDDDFDIIKGAMIALSRLI